MGLKEKDGIVTINEWMIVVDNDCSICKHFLEDISFKEDHPTCNAFKTIPMKIWAGEISHRRPIKGDKGIQFEDKNQKP